MSRFFLTIAIASLTIGIFAASAGDSNAASPICSKLQRQLASLSGGRSRASNSPAIRQLRSQLTQARIGARRAGCTGGLFSRPSSTPQCVRIKASIDKLTASIAQMKRGGGGSGANRKRVLAALSANDCGSPRRSGGLIKRLFNSKKQQVEPKAAVAPKVKRTKAAVQPKRKQKRAPVKRRAESASTSGRVSATNEGAAPTKNYSVKSGFRTLCVRTCDGYYFPISFSTKRKFFARDRNACSAMCPGTDVALYYHDVKDEESEDMVSTDTDTPYAALPTAFDYRTAGTATPPGCACQAVRQSLPESGFSAQDQTGPSSPGAKNYMTLGYGSGEKTVSDKTSSFISIPRKRPDPAADPETMLNTEGGLNREDLQKLTDRDTSVVTSSTGNRIRVVGPTFLPDLREARGRQVPGQTKAR
ncbi:hypothetical protein C5748_20920 [Phyllobacterium phragmitis]|uniref:DUF2865 domain-containing protein n=1 Tax=Phyllobacterium phragmitis TaxID=2670329 RepID=A0A2S9IM02_9HYPH|nr:DUF2865 domain-containing protein [Phyllobacterium phragmitis]PRD41545.1 hypothetical protein C5748_20920 [Phyllobacterium phragmitis]